MNFSADGDVTVDTASTQTNGAGIATTGYACAPGGQGNITADASFMGASDSDTIFVQAKVPEKKKIGVQFFFRLVAPLNLNVGNGYQQQPGEEGKFLAICNAILQGEINNQLPANPAFTREYIFTEKEIMPLQNLSITVAPDNVGGFTPNYGPDNITILGVNIQNVDDGVAVVIIWAEPID